MNDLLKLQDSETVKNTFYRAPKVTPTIENKHTYIEVRTVDDSAQIDKLAEVILYIISEFKFAPYWQVQQWFDAFDISYFSIVKDWISVGLVWAETSTMGVFIRPTRLLLDMFKTEDKTYKQIPFGLLNHTCCEAQLMFDIMTGNNKSEMWQILKSDNILPCYHPLHIKPTEDTGTIVIREDSFKVNRYNVNELKKKEEDLEIDIRAGNAFTKEFEDFSLFPIVNYTDDNQLITQTPDIIVPIPRQDSKPMSYAIELELSSKTAAKYLQIMKNYRNNIKFGKLYYLCGSSRIMKMVKDAYDSVGGLGTCELFIVPFIPPANRMSNYTAKDEHKQRIMLDLTGVKTNGDR